MVAQAEETARAAIAAAEATAAQLQAETHQKLREEVARLETTRTELATDVESMARHLESERNRLRGALSEILKWVDENVQPANSLMGVKPKAARAARPGRPEDARATAGGGRRCADAEPAERVGLGSASAPLNPLLTGAAGLVAPVPRCPVSSPAPRTRSSSGNRPPDVVRRRER